MKTLYESGENYLETIQVLKSEKGTVFSVDIANRMGFSKASVSRAVKILSSEDYIVINSNGAIDFTQKGADAASAIYERHKIITSYLKDILFIKTETAENDACRIEHVISEETFLAIKNSLKN